MSTDDTLEPTTGQPPVDHEPISRYEIRVSGHLSARWATWFDGMTLSGEDDGTTVISGAVVDQAALHGLLQKLRDLGVCLLSLTRVAPGTAPDRPDHQTEALHNPPGATS